MRVAVFLFAIVAAFGPAAADVHGVPIPRGSRIDNGRYTSGLGFRATVDWYRRRWRERAIPVRTVGPYHARGVDVVRFIQEGLGSEWLAVHVYRTAGKTMIFVVPRVGLDAERPTE